MTGCSRRTHHRESIASGIAVIGFFGQHGLILLAFEQDGRGKDVARLAGRDQKPQRPSARIGPHVDLGGQSASGTPQRLILGPPFPLAAC